MALPKLVDQGLIELIVTNALNHIDATIGCHSDNYSKRQALAATFIAIFAGALADLKPEDREEAMQRVNALLDGFQRETN